MLPNRSALALFIADGHAEEDWSVVDPCVRNFYMLEAEKARPMTGFLATLSPDQQKMALEYDGPENHGGEAEPPEESFDMSGGPIKSETVCEQ